MNQGGLPERVLQSPASMPAADAAAGRHRLLVTLNFAAVYVPVAVPVAGADAGHGDSDEEQARDGGK